MSFTLRQVQPLLTKPELELFEASRAGAIKSLTERQLTARVTRARTLRDKYRDNYRRQTVATRTGPAAKRTLQGADNVRTATKAEIMADLVTRFEAQLAKLEADAAKAAKAAAKKAARRHNAPGAPTTKTNPKAAQRSRRSSGDAEPGAGADLPMRGASTTKPRQLARAKRSAAEVGHAVVSARGAASTRAGGAAGKKAAATKTATKTAAKKAPAKKAPAKKSAAKKSATRTAAKKTTAKTAITGAKQPAAKLMKQVRSAVEQKQATPPVEGQPRARRAIRAEVGGGSTAIAQGAVPTNMPAKAQRLNPLKAQPINKTIHASARARQQAATAKRDSR